MAETRRLVIRRKRFTKSDLRGLGELFLSEAETARQAGRNPSVTFTLRCNDGSEYSAADLSHFADGAEVDLKRPTSVEFRFGDGALGRWVTLSLNHGHWTDGTLSVSGEAGYKEWVAGVFTKLQERVAASEPSESWFTRHPRLTYHLLAFGCGSLIILALNYMMALGVAHGVIVVSDNSGPVEPGSIRFMFSRVPALEFAFAWGIRWLFGSLAAPWIREWLLGAWPVVDLDVGPQHLKLEDMRRRRIAAFFGLGVIPFAVQFLYDMVMGV